jgi:hypothetical protein
MGTWKQLGEVKRNVRLVAFLIGLIFAVTIFCVSATLAFSTRAVRNQSNFSSQAITAKTPKKKKKIKKTEKPKMTRQTQTAVSQGNWGGEGIRMSIEENSSAIEFACANAEISEKLLMDQSGNFKASGFFIRQRPGPQREGEPQRLAAKFSGTVSGKNMSLKLTLTDSGETIGEYSLEQGKNVRIHRCL